MEWKYPFTHQNSSGVKGWFKKLVSKTLHKAGDITGIKNLPSAWGLRLSTLDKAAMAAYAKAAKVKTDNDNYCTVTLYAEDDFAGDRLTGAAGSAHDIKTQIKPKLIASWAQLLANGKWFKDSAAAKVKKLKVKKVQWEKENSNTTTISKDSYDAAVMHPGGVPFTSDNKGKDSSRADRNDDKKVTPEEWAYVVNNAMIYGPETSDPSTWWATNKTDPQENSRRENAIAKAWREQFVNKILRLAGESAPASVDKDTYDNWLTKVDKDKYMYSLGCNGKKARAGLWQGAGFECTIPSSSWGAPWCYVDRDYDGPGCSPYCKEKIQPSKNETASYKGAYWMPCKFQLKSSFDALNENEDKEKEKRKKTLSKTVFEDAVGGQWKVATIKSKDPDGQTFFLPTTWAHADSGLRVSSFKAEGNCAKFEIMDNDGECLPGDEDNYVSTDGSSVSSVSEDLDNDVCAIKVWAKKAVWPVKNKTSDEGCNGKSAPSGPFVGAGSSCRSWGWKHNWCYVDPCPANNPKCHKGCVPKDCSKAIKKSTDKKTGSSRLLLHAMRT
jgi:hypothetical protein